MKKHNINEIKVINIAQPHAHNVIFNGKNVENRTMYSKYRGTVAIYASKTFNKHRFENQSIKKEECSFGCIIGFVDIVDCITEEKVNEKTDKWFSGPYGYVFENVVILKNPIEVSPPNGAIVWWNLSGAKLDLCLDQVQISRIIPLTSVDAEAKHDLKKKHLPSELLAEIVGAKPMTLKQIASKLIEYAEENELIKSEGDEDDDLFYFILSDKKLKKLFGKDKIYAIELGDDVVKILN